MCLILDDNTGNPLAGAYVKAKDSKGVDVIAFTDADGKFKLLSKYFYMGNIYTVNFSRNNYIPGFATAPIVLSGDNVINGSPKKLFADITIAGVVKKDLDDVPGSPYVSGSSLEGIVVSILDSNGDIITRTTNSEGEYSFSYPIPGIRKGVTYTLNFSHNNYYSGTTDTDVIIPGSNALGDIFLASKPATGHMVSGIVEDFWSNSGISANVFLEDKHGVLTQTAGGDGSFSITGDFDCGVSYPLIISLNGYSGETEIDREEISLEINCGTNPQVLVNTIKLYPIGIRANIAGVSSTDYSTDIHPTYEKFLTDKIGFTLSARDGSNMNTCSTFFLHVDENINVPAPPEGVYSSTVAVNGNLVRGAISHGIAGENSSRPSNQKPSSFGVNSFVYYHFYVSDTGSFTIETAGSTDTYMYLYNSTGSEIAHNDDGGSGTNAKITSSLGSIGWYFVKVKGYDDSKYGEFTMTATGPVQNNGSTETWNSDNLVISMYSNSDKKIYIAGEGESGSSGTITISKYDEVGKLIRGSFSGIMREVSSAGTTKGVTDGYFNVIRSQ